MALVMTYDPVDSRAMMYQASFHSRMLMSCLRMVVLQSFMSAANVALGGIDSMIYAALQISDRVYDFFMRPSVKRFRLPARLQYHLAMIWRFWPTLASRFVFVFCWSFVFQFAFQFARLAGYI